MLNLPVNVGIVGTVLAPWAAVAGVVAVFGTKCTVELVKDSGEVVDISEMATDTFEEVVEKGSIIADEMKEKGGEVFESVKSKASEAFDKASDAFDKAKKKGADVAEDVEDFVEEVADEFKPED